jgi:surfactin synthase thioesterase subunit
MEKIALICLPFAGGNKYSYRPYIEVTPPFLSIIPLEYPGRGSRLKAAFITDLDCLVEDLYHQAHNAIRYQRFAIYGHSMGGLLACLLARKIIENNEAPPLHVFITGTPGPAATSRTNCKRHLLDKEEFIKELRRLKGIPEEMLRNEELLSFLEPIIRADFRVSEEYVYKEKPPLDVPFTVITGTEEEMEIADIHLWQKETKYTIDFRQIPGSHFFIFDYPAIVMDTISDKLFNHSKIVRS